MSTDAIEVSGEIPTTPEMAYQAFVDPELHAAMTGAAATAVKAQLFGAHGVRPKALFEQPMNGTMLVDLATTYLNAMNSGGVVPTIKGAWEYVLQPCYSACCLPGGYIFHAKEAVCGTCCGSKYDGFIGV